MKNPIKQFCQSLTIPCGQALHTGETGCCDAVTVNEKKTTPPPLFTEATLMAALVRVADFVEDARIKQLLKDKDKDKKDEHGGIGTTRYSLGYAGKTEKPPVYLRGKRQVDPH